MAFVQQDTRLPYKAEPVKEEALVDTWREMGGGRCTQTDTKAQPKASDQKGDPRLEDWKAQNCVSRLGKRKRILMGAKIGSSNLSGLKV